RGQSIQQTAQAANELPMYWPIYDVWHDTNAPFKTLGVHYVDNWLHPTEFSKQSSNMQRLGYSFDFASDAILARSSVRDNKIVTAEEARLYQVIYVPTTQYFSEETLGNLLNLARDGATVIFETLPQDVDGLANLETRRKKLHDLLET